MRESTLSFAPTISRFSGFAGDYDRHRPQPPAALLSQLTGAELPALVADPGSGTGLSSRECVLRRVDEGDAGRFLGLLRSQGGVMDLLKAGFSEDQLGISEFESIAREELGPELRPWYWSARVRIGVV